MLKKSLLPFVFGALLVAVIGATNSPPSAPLVEVGSLYLISNGTAAMKATVVADLGSGWFLVKRTDTGKTVKLNVGHAFFIEGLTK